MAVGQAERAKAVAWLAAEQRLVAKLAADACADQSHLLPLAVDDEETAVWLCKNCLDEAIYAQQRARARASSGRSGHRRGMAAPGAAASVGGEIEAAVGAGAQVLGVLLEELDWKRPSLAARKGLVQVVQQVVGEGFWRAGVGRPGDVCVEQADARRSACLNRFVLPVYPAVRVYLEQTFDQQNGVGVPVGQGGEIRPFAKIRDVVERRVQKGRHRYRAGKVAKLVAVHINPERLAALGDEKNVRLVQVPHHDLQLVQAAERLVQPLKQGDDLPGTQGVLLPKVGLAEPLDRLGGGGQFGHLQADELARFVVDGGAGG